MNSRLIISIVYITLGMLIIMYRPEYVNTYILLATPILSYYYAREMERMVKEKSFNLVSDLLLFVALMLIVFVIAVVLAQVIAGVRI